MGEVKDVVNTTVSAAKNFFSTLNAVDVSGKVKQKNGLTYLSWSSAWAEVKKADPGAVFKIYPQVMDALGNTRFWHDDGKTGWVEVGVTVGGIELVETLAIMDFKNKSLAADQITTVDANKAMKRCLVKAIAMHGLGLYIYEGEDLPEEAAKVKELRDEIMTLGKKKADQSPKAKEKVAILCKEAEKKDNPHLNDDEVTGNIRNIDNVETLEELKMKIMAVRK